MMSQTIKECCDKDGKPAFAKMKGFMEACGKAEFTDNEIKMMRQFCNQSGKLDAEKMQQLMKEFGC